MFSLIIQKLSDASDKFLEDKYCNILDLILKTFLNKRKNKIKRIFFCYFIKKNIFLRPFPV
jgi:hypothetical protein